jgi:IS30 family transposase
MHQAGIFTGKSADAQRREFLRLRQEGRSRAEAAAAAGIDKRSAQDWDKGIRQFYGGRIYPGGRIVKYNSQQVLPAVKSPRTTYIQGERIDTERAERIISPRYLSLPGRERPRDLHAEGFSIRKIAASLGRAPSTVSREPRRDTVLSRGYMPHAAHRVSARRRARPKPSKLLSSGVLLEYVQARLRKKWSPQQISARLIKDFPDTPEMRVSTETIYQGIYVHTRGELKRELVSGLRRGRSIRKPRKDPDARRRRFADSMTPISDRPVEAESRIVPGHREGDLIIGAGSQSAIAALVERSSRCVVLGYLGAERTAEIVRDSLVSAVTGLPMSLRRTLTWDQGSEMAEHRSFAMATGMRVFFCDPGAPWQRGSNENTNGLLRQYFPEGSDLRVHSEMDLRAVAEELNGRPRKALGWDTPAERLSALLAAS